MIVLLTYLYDDESDELVQEYRQEISQPPIILLFPNISYRQKLSPLYKLYCLLPEWKLRGIQTWERKSTTRWVDNIKTNGIR